MKKNLTGPKFKYAEKVKADSLANISVSNKDFWTTLGPATQSNRVAGFSTKF